MANQLKIGALFSYLAIFINIVIGIVYTPWMIRSIGQDAFGLYTLAMSCITLFAIDFGLGNAVTRFVSKYRAENSEHLTANLMGIVYKLYLGIDAIILIALSSIYIFIPEIYKGLTPIQLEQFKVVYVIASAFCVISFPFIPLNGLLTSYEKFIWLKGCDIAHKLLIVCLMAICLCMGYGLYALVTVNVVAGIVTILLKLYIVYKETPVRVKFRHWDTYLFKQVMNFSIWVTVSVLAQRCIFNLAPSILGIVSNAEAIAVLGVAITIEGYTYTFGNAINGMFLPRISKLVADGRRDEIVDLMIKVGRLQILVIGLILIGFTSIGQEFISLWVGNNFAGSYACVIFLIIPSFIHIPQEVAATLIIVDNKVKQQSFVYIAMALVNLLLGFPLAKYYGAIGLSISIGISYLVRIVLMNLLYVKELKLNILKFFRESFFKMLPALILSLIVCIFICHLYCVTGWLSFCVKGLICICVYAGAQWALSMNNYEKDLVRLAFHKLF